MFAYSEIDGKFTNVLAIWSNQNQRIAWGHKNSCKLYNYPNEIIKLDSIILDYENERSNDWQCEEYWYGCVKYSEGNHRSKLIQLSKDNDINAVYFEKRGRYWWLVGVILRIVESEDININNVSKYWELEIDFIKNQIYSEYTEISKIGIKLATNKKDSLNLLGWKKKEGKGKGNLNYGICCIEKLEECYINQLGVWKLCTFNHQIDPKGFENNSLWYDDKKEEIWYLEGSKYVEKYMEKCKKNIKTKCIFGISNIIAAFKGQCWIEEISKNLYNN